MNTPLMSSGSSSDARSRTWLRVSLLVGLALTAVVLVATSTPGSNLKRNFQLGRAAPSPNDLSKYWGVREGSHYKGPRADIAFGNVVASTTAFPYVVRIVHNTHGAWCTGNIISPNYILTAAHCVANEAVNAFQFIVGTVTTAGAEPTKQVKTAVSFHIHQGYQSGSWFSDIALVKVNSPFTSGASVNGISLISARPAPGTQLTAAGWGATETGVISNVLKSATMSVVTCGWHQNEANDICTQGGSGNTCGGDSGGPLVKGTGNNQELVGLNSFSKTACSNFHGNVDVFEQTTPFLSWVNGYLPVYQLEMMTIPGKDNSQNNDGVYTRSGSMIFNRMIYKNGAKSRFIAWNNHMWVITHTYYLDGLIANPSAGFGGYHWSSQANTKLECAKFPNYIITPQKIILTLKPGASNYANADGTYVKSNSWLNGYPIYVNSADSMFLGYGGSWWTITHTYYQAGLLSSQAKNFGGYHHSTSGATTAACSTWGGYTVKVE